MLFTLKHDIYFRRKLSLSFILCSSFIHSDPVASTLIISLSQTSHRCYLYFGTKMNLKALVVVEIYKDIYDIYILCSLGMLFSAKT